MPDKPENVRAILRLWLRDNGYEGLYDDSECVCVIDELIPCDGPFAGCRPGYKGPDPSGKCDFLIYPTKQAVADAHAEIAAMAADDAAGEGQS